MSAIAGPDADLGVGDPGGLEILYRTACGRVVVLESLNSRDHIVLRTFWPSVHDSVARAALMGDDIALEVEADRQIYGPAEFFR
jgi:hypothetical protein